MQDYTYKQVILALREEYKKNEKRLNALKRFVKTTDKVVDFDFFVDSDEENNYIELYLQSKQNRIRRLLETISLSFKKKEYKKNINIPNIYEETGRYLVLPDNDDYSIDEMNELMTECNNLLLTRFSKHIHSVIRARESNLKMEITASGILSYTDYLVSKYPAVGLLYRSTNDKIILTAYEDSLYFNQLNNLLNIEIPGELIPDYHRELIEKSKDKDKELSIKGFETTKVSQHFSFEDRDDGTVLLQRTK